MKYANGLKTGRLYKYEQQAIALTQDAITNSLPDICKKQSRGRSAQYEIDRQREPLTGFCYLGAQAVWVLLANLKGWKDEQGEPKYLPAVIPRQYLDGEDTHWFVVRVKDGTIVDPTAAQFTKRIPYEHAVVGAGKMASHLRTTTGTAQQWKDQGVFTPDTKTAALLDVITKKDNPSWKQKKPTTDFSRLKRNQKVIMYHATSMTDAIKMINGFDTNRLVRSKYHPQGYSFRGLYVAPVPIRSFGYVVFKLALRTNNLHGTSWSANIGRPSDPTYDAKEAAYNQKRSEQMYPDSFRPYLSYTLLRPTEPQALYRGIVSPDMILGVEVGGNGVWLTREEFMQEYDVEEFFEGFDPNSPNYTVDEYLDYIGGGKRERQRVIDTIHRMMRYDRDPERRNDNVDRLMNQLDFGVSAQRSFLRKFKQKYGDGSQRNPRRRRNSAYDQRAINAGADPSTLKIIGEGGEGVVFTDRTGKVFKVGKKDLYNEAVALSVLAQYDYAPRFYGYDNKNNVIVRDYVEGKIGRWGDDLWDHYQTIGKILNENDLTRPEYKEESFVFLPDGRVHMYDVGFVHLLGKRLVDDLKRKDPSLITDSMEAFDYESDVIAAVNDGYLTKEQGRKMLSRLANEHWRNAGLDILSNPRRRRNGTRLVPKEQVRMVGFSPEKTAEVEPTIPYILEAVEYIANEGELLFPSPIRPMTKAEFSDGRSVVDVGHPNGAGHGQYDTVAVEVAINPNMEPFDIAANVFHENLHHACPEMTEVQVRDMTGEAMLFLFGEYNLGKPYAEGRLKANPKGKKKVTRDSKGRKIPDRYLSGFTGKARKERIAEIEQRRDEYAKAIDKYGDEDKIPQKIKRKLYRPFVTDQGIVTQSSSYTKEAHRRGFEGGIAEKAQAASKYYGGKIPKNILDTVMDRGMAAWASGGHRPGQTPQSWGYARVNSFLVGGKTFWTADADLTKKLPKSVALAIADQSVFSPSLSVLWSD